ncbi:branched-chain amino acid ABC transporter substrate-binding protein [Desulfoprunum benzoelyticum]|uniref:Branched-chain amino acid transport system substrate-binding protein n=1 Tax=Desulfoprunum benzoelyticum TaxID=1506996 RepID=A0A840UX42_9BACT|nr:branched-chain amino acid ABC transporter substrate-binding protein [Desulfoprunum benzoelyticum]MBB5347258.1 branched-chain amino acid transport system substrate-binding protein [Desulfoprunum benzoelyticum]MBM9531392.1 branched-chain amino acid ABC transporter substrate-binding protein [Desulfoprunum benzoelyticum]
MKKLLSLVAGLGLLLGTSALAADTVKIGLMGPMTGAWASEGQEMKQVVELLADELNQKGGLLGKQVAVISEDDAGDPRQASLAANRLATQGIVGVIGTYGSSITEATQNIYDEAGIIQVANGSTAIRLSEKGLANFFRTCPRDDEQGKVATATISKLGHKKIAILHDNTSYAKGLAEEAQANLKGLNIPVVFFDALTPGERDYNTILTKMKAAGPDFVFFTGYYPEAGLLLRQKKEMGWDVPFMGGDAVNNPELVKIAGAAATEGFLFLTPPLPKDLDTPEAKSFVAAFEKKFGSAPKSIYPVLAGDGFRVLAEAIKGANSVEPAKVSAFMKTALKDFPGLTGKISFNDKGDRIGEVYRVYQVNNQGDFVLQP